MIVIPMAGLSRRFFDAGFDRPKYMLEIHGATLFRHAIGSFRRYFGLERFVFVVRDVFNTPAFVERECEGIGIADRQVTVLAGPTRGQAETVHLGLEDAGARPDQPLTVFNVDTIRPGLSFPACRAEADGYLEVFEGDGDNWSFARPAHPGSTRVAETAEKRPISRLCSTGLYHFARTGDFRDAYEREIRTPSTAELYVAPLYNHLIADGKDIRYEEIARGDVIFCGVPEEYHALKALPPRDLDRLLGAHG